MLQTVPGVYIASKTKHAPRWLNLREKGYPFISTWIDEAGVGDTSDWTDLWNRCLFEAATAKALIVYREPEDVLKGGFAELGTALFHAEHYGGRKILAIGMEEFSISRHYLVNNVPNLKTALHEAWRFSRYPHVASPGQLNNDLF